MRQYLLLPFIVVIFPWAAQAASFESEALRVDVSETPYTWTLTDKRNSRVILKHRGTDFKNNSRKGTLDKAQVLRHNSQLLELDLRNTKEKQRAVLKFSFPRPDILKVSLVLENAQPDENDERENVRIAEKFVDQNERYYGLWEAAWDRDQNDFADGKLPDEVQLDNRGVRYELKGGKYGAHGSDWTSARAPFHMSSLGYGIYVESLWAGRYELAYKGQTKFEFDTERLDYYVLAGADAKSTLALHNQVAGPSVMPPLWAFGSAWWRDDVHKDMRGAGGKGKFTTSDEVIRNDVAELRKLRVPLSIYHLDRPILDAPGTIIVKGYGTNDEGKMVPDKSFTDLRGLSDELLNEGVRMTVFIANRTEGNLRKEGKPLGFLFDDGDGAVDLRVPGAAQWIASKLMALPEMGFAGYKIDRGDEHNQYLGLTLADDVPDHMTNYNGAHFPKVAYDTLLAAGHAEPYVYVRTLYDRGRRYASIWNGDAFDWKGLRESIKHALRAGLINFPIWTSDTGGYKSTNPELFARWAQFSAYTPVMEVMFGPKGRVPWYDYDAVSTERIAAAARLKHELIPYAYSLAQEAVRSGMPPVRPLFVEFPNDAHASDLADQYMFGPSFLVAPVYQAGAKTRSVYLPAGRWLEQSTGRVLEGGARVNATLSMEEIPVYVRENALVVRGDIARFSNNWTPAWEARLNVEYFPGRNAQTRFAYNVHGTVGSSGVQEIVAQRQGDRISVSFGDLGAGGELRIRARAPQRLSLNGQLLIEGQGYNVDAKRGTINIPFEAGPALLEIEGAEVTF